VELEQTPIQESVREKATSFSLWVFKVTRVVDRTGPFQRL